MVRTVEGHHYNQRSPSEQEEALSVDDHQAISRRSSASVGVPSTPPSLDFKGTIMKKCQ